MSSVGLMGFKPYSDSNNDLEFCHCLEGLNPRAPQTWESQDWSGGCIRSSPLQFKTDKFYELGNAYLDSSSSVLVAGVLIESREKFCLDNSLGSGT
jgi:hypothetical protein